MQLFYALLILTAAVQAHAAQPTYSIMQGSTSASVTHFTVVARADENLQFQTATGTGLLMPTRAQKVTIPGSEWAVHRLRFEGMKPQREYQLQVWRDGELKDERWFKTIDPEHRAGRVALASCMLRQFHNPFLWRSLANENNRPDLLLLLGDAVYLDRSHLLRARLPENELQVWEDFVKSRNKLGLYFWRNLVPTLAVWDDHDSGGDNIDAKWEMMPKIFNIFETFMANDAIDGGLERGPGLAMQFRAMGRNFVMMDGRSFRQLDPMNPHFGLEQENWLMDKLQTGDNFLLSGSQWFGRMLAKDSFEYNWPGRAYAFFERLRIEGERKNALIAFASGDVHFSEVQDLEPRFLGYWTVEVTSSSAHSFAFPGHYALKPYNPRRRRVTGTHNVVLMEFKSTTQGFGFNVRSLGWRGNTLFETYAAITPAPCEVRLGALGNDRR